MKFLGIPSSGSVAAETFARNTYGQYSRARAGRGGTPVLSIGLGVAAWQALTWEQQQAWNEWCIQWPSRDGLGQTVTLSGYNAFLRTWMTARFALGVDPGITVPIEAGQRCVVTAVRIVSVSGSTVDAECDISAGSGYQFWDYGAPYSSLGTNSPPGRGAAWKVLSGGSVVGPGTFPLTQVFPSPPSAKRIFLRAFCYGLDWVPIGPRVVCPPAEIS